MLYPVLVLLLILWLLGFSFHVGGSMIHAVLVIVLVVWLLDWVAGRRRD